MANLLNRHTLEFIESVDQTDFHTRTGTNPVDWIRNPDLSAVSGIPRRMWKLVDQRPEPMTAEEYAAKTDAEIAAASAASAAANPERTAVRAALAAIEADATAWEAIKDTATAAQTRAAFTKLVGHVTKLARYVGKL